MCRETPSTSHFKSSAPACCSEWVDGSCCIKVLGIGRKSCHEQYENATAIAKAMGLSVEVESITDMEKAMAYGVMRMPAIVVNDRWHPMARYRKPRSGSADPQVGVLI